MRARGLVSLLTVLVLGSPAMPAYAEGGAGVGVLGLGGTVAGSSAVDAEVPPVVIDVDPGTGLPRIVSGTPVAIDLAGGSGSSSTPPPPDLFDVHGTCTYQVTGVLPAAATGGKPSMVVELAGQAASGPFPALSTFVECLLFNNLDSLQSDGVGAMNTASTAASKIMLIGNAPTLCIRGSAVAQDQPPYPAPIQFGWRCAQDTIIT